MKYRIAKYRDGNNKMIYRPQQWAWWWPFWRRIEFMDSPWSYFVLEYETEAEALDWIARTTTQTATLKRQRVRDRVA